MESLAGPTRPEHPTTSPISRPTPPAADLAPPGVNVAGAAVSPAAAALSARVAELLAMLDHSGVVRVVNVEPLPDGKTGYDLRILPEARAMPSTGAARIGEAVQRVARVADLLVQGKAAGMVLRGHGPFLGRYARSTGSAPGRP